MLTFDLILKEVTDNTLNSKWHSGVIRTINPPQERINRLFQGYLPHFQSHGESFRPFIDVLAKELHISDVSDRFTSIDEDRNRSGNTLNFRDGNPFPSKINVQQHKHIYRQLIRRACPINADSVLIRALPHIKINQKKARKLIRTAQGTRNKLLITRYYNNSLNRYWEFYGEMINVPDQVSEVFELREYLARLLQDAMIGTTLDQKYRSSEVTLILKQMRGSEDFGGMVILADALQDAGFQDEVVLTHLRSPDAKFSLGSGLFRAVGLT